METYVSRATTLEPMEAWMATSNICLQKATPAASGKSHSEPKFGLNKVHFLSISTKRKYKRLLCLKGERL